MQILVNQQNLDFTLEMEKTVGDVYRELSKWLETSGYVIIRMLGDNEEYNLDETSSWNTTPVEDVGVLDVTAQSPAESLFSVYQVIYDYFELLEKALGNEAFDEIREIISEFESTKTGACTHPLVL